MNTDNNTSHHITSHGAKNHIQIFFSETIDPNATKFGWDGIL
jgi:hypothetical protein